MTVRTDAAVRRWFALVIVSDDGVGDTGPGEYLTEDEMRAVIEQSLHEVNTSGIEFQLMTLGRFE